MRVSKNRIVSSFEMSAGVNGRVLVDDHCYLVEMQIGDDWVGATWLPTTAVIALQDLPEDPDDAFTVDEMVAIDEQADAQQASVV